MATINIGELIMERPEPDQSGWYYIKQQSFTINKDDFILERFNEDFPHLKVNDIKQFELVLSRSTILQDWYAKTSLIYTDSIQLPVAFKDLFKPDEYQGYFKDMQQYKNNLAKQSGEIENASKEFTKKVDLINDKYKKLNDIIIASNKIYPILTLTGQLLPLSIQIEIENYTPKTGDVTQQRTVYAREMLINYKRALITKLKDDESIDVLQLIEDNRVK